MLNQCALVLEGVTLAQVVKLVVEVLVNLAAGTVLDEEAAENAESAHPNDLAVAVVSACSIFLASIEPVRSCIAYLGIRASAVPLRLPKPLCLPSLFASVWSLARALECMVTGLRMMRPSATSLRMVWRELALEISETSFGSSQILRCPHPTTAAARRFWVRRLTLKIAC